MRPAILTVESDVSLVRFELINARNEQRDFTVQGNRLAIPLNDGDRVGVLHLATITSKGDKVVTSIDENVSDWNIQIAPKANAGDQSLAKNDAQQSMSKVFSDLPWKKIGAGLAGLAVLGLLYKWYTSRDDRPKEYRGYISPDSSSQNPRYYEPAERYYDERYPRERRDRY